MPALRERYRLVEEIGHGGFSTVTKLRTAACPDGW